MINFSVWSRIRLEPLFCLEQESEPTQKCSLAPTWLRTKKIPVSLNPLLMPFKLNRKETVNFSEHQNSKKNRKNPKLQNKKQKIKPVYTRLFPDLNFVSGLLFLKSLETTVLSESLGRMWICLKRFSVDWYSTFTSQPPASSVMMVTAEA